MLTNWLKGHKDKEERVKELNSYRNALDDLKEILERDFRKKPCRDYGDPNWVYRQIAANEYNQVLDDVIKLITFEKE